MKDGQITIARKHWNRMKELADNKETWRLKQVMEGLENNTNEKPIISKDQDFDGIGIA